MQDRYQFTDRNTEGYEVYSTKRDKKIEEMKEENDKFLHEKIEDLKVKKKKGFGKNCQRPY